MAGRVQFALTLVWNQAPSSGSSPTNYRIQSNCISVRGDFYGSCKRIFARFFIFPVLVNTGEYPVNKFVSDSIDDQHLALFIFTNSPMIIV